MRSAPLRLLAPVLLLIAAGCAADAGGGAQPDTDAEPDAPVEGDRPAEADDADDDRPDADAGDDPGPDGDDVTDTGDDTIDGPPADDDEAAEDAPDPCVPNPCTDPLKRLCSARDGAAVCACDPALAEDDGAGGCRVRTRPAALDAPAVYTLRVRVTLPDGAPAADAVVSAGGVTGRTDAAGAAALDNLPAAPRTLTVTADGAAPLVRAVDAISAGRGTLNLVVRPLTKARPFAAAQGGEAAADGARLAFPPRAVVTADGTPYTGEVRVALTAVDPGTAPAAVPGDLRLEGADGAPMTAEPAGIVFADLRDDADRPLAVADGARVGVTLPLGDGLQPRRPDGTVNPNAARAGDELVLAALDEARGVWVEQSRCLVQPRPRAVEGDATVLECAGAVSHFSWWAMMKAARPMCLNVKPTLRALPAGLEIRSWGVAVTAEHTTALDSASLLRNAVRLPAEGARPASICALVPWRSDASFVVSVTLDLFDTAANRGVVVRRQTTVTADAAAALDGTAALRSLRDTPAALCYATGPAACAQINVVFEAAAIPAELLVDADADGFYAPSAALPEGVRADCNDDDAGVYPGAPEPACAQGDKNCDGNAPAAPRLSQYAGRAARWNALCAAARGFPQTKPWTRTVSAWACVTFDAEVPGNDFDENCDGFITDQDGDGFAAAGDAAAFEGRRPGVDCDDTNPGAKPDAAERPGNAVDENCDNVVLDADGDGYFRPDHAGALAGSTLADQSVDAALFRDCDDGNASANPDSTRPENHLARWFYRDEAFTAVRAGGYCGLFDAAGRFTPAARAALVDYNCDGLLTDLDGDGYTVPGDNALGADYAYDCDDLDPRVRPERPSAGDGETPPCGPRPGGVDSTTCSPDRTGFGADGRRVCPRLPDGTRARCDDLVDQQNRPWGVYVCNADGWNGDPLSAAQPAGAAWQPCDFGAGRLPPCAGGLNCAYSATAAGRYSNGYADWLRTTWGIDVTGVPNVGMCMPRCGDLCNPVNPCREPGKRTCTIVERQAFCSCDQGFTVNARNRCVPADCGTACDDCGDGTCTGREDAANCPFDCTGGDADTDTDGGDTDDGPAPDAWPTGRFRLSHVIVPGDTSNLSVGDVMAVELGIVPTPLHEAEREIQVTLQLVERASLQAPADTLRNLRTCVLGSGSVVVPAAPADPVFLNLDTLPVTADCLGTGGPGEFNLMVQLDAAVDADGNRAPGHTVVVLNQREQARPEAEGCRRGKAVDAPAGCIYDISVGPAGELDVQMTEVQADSSVVAVPPQKGPGDPGPAVFAAARPTIRLTGVPAGESVENVLPGGVVLRYSVAPAGSTDWAPLRVEWYRRADPADPASPFDQPDTIAEVVETNLAAGQARTYTHNLIADEALIARMTAGDWAGAGTFVLRACVYPPFTTPSESLAGPDNCKTVELAAERPPPETPNWLGGVLNANKSWKRNYGWQASFGACGKLCAAGYIGTDAEYSMLPDQWRGAYFRGFVTATVQIWSFAFALFDTQMIARGRTDGGTNQFRLYVKAFEIMWYDFNKEAPGTLEQTWPLGSWSVVKEKQVKTTIWLAIVPLTVGATARGTIGLSAKLRLRTGTGQDPQSPMPGVANPIAFARITGLSAGTGYIAGLLEAGVGFGYGVTGFGVGGSLKLFEVYSPFNPEVYGVVDGGGGRMVIRPSLFWSLILTPLQAAVYLWASYPWCSICWKWIIPYPCKCGIQTPHMNLWSYSSPPMMKVFVNDSWTWVLQ